jgi:hypothetical protein
MRFCRRSSITATRLSRKRFIFYKRLLPLLEFGREREGIDLSKVMLTHHNLKHQGQSEAVAQGQGDYPKLDPISGLGHRVGAGKGEGVPATRLSPR